MKIEEHQITESQIASIHVYFRELAKALNDIDLTVKVTLAKAPYIDSPWNENLIKDLFARPLMKAIAPDKTTMRLNTIEAQELYEVINRFTAENFGISMPFPIKEDKE